MVLRSKGCPKCKGDLWLDLDEYGWYEQCIMCGYLCSLDGLTYVAGAEKLVVTRQCNPKLYPFYSVIETLKQAMRAKMEEACGNIMHELSQGALERRQLKMRLIGKGILKYTFDIALRELRKTGVVTTVATAQGKRKKLVLSAGKV